MSITVLHTGPSCLIRLDGELTLACAEELKEALINGLREAENLELDLENASEVDLTTLQLLSAAARDAATRGVRLVTRASSQVRTSARDAGFAELTEYPAGA